MSTPRLDYQYDANFGRIRNLRGNKTIEDQLDLQHNKNKNRKKQFQIQKGEIEQFQIINRGQSYASKVDDLILNVSDIPGAQSNSRKSDAIRNRLVAKNLREDRQRRSKSQRQITQEIPPFQKPQNHNILRRNIHQLSQQNISTLETQKIRLDSSSYNPSSQFQQRRKNRSNNISRLPTIIVNPQKHNINSNTSKYQSLPSSQKQITVEKSESFVKQITKLQQRILNYKRDRNPAKIVSQTERCAQVPSFKNCQSLGNASRINPTFLSYGSQFLSNNNNYLASYGKSVLF